MRSFLILLSLFFLCSCSTETKSGETLKVMTFNIRYGTARDGDNRWTNRKDHVVEVIKKYSPDVLGLQEALDFQIKQILEANPEYKYVGISREGAKTTKGEYSCILYKKDKFEAVSDGTYWLSSTPDKPSTSWGNQLKRIWTQLEIKSKSSGKIYFIYNTHFDHRSQPSRVKASELLLEKIKTRSSQAPFILMGDLNSLPESPQIKLLTDNKDLPMVETHMKMAKPGENLGTFSKFEYGNFGRKIDYIFVEKGKSKIKKSMVVRDSKNKKYPSDHFPVYAELEFQ